jgi:cold shock CspA family protein/ribosome-associated translation inhibitor RaiA
MVRMELDLRFTVRNTTLTKKAEQIVRREAAKLERFHPRIVSCRVVVGPEHRFPTGAPVTYTVRIELTVPRGRLLTTRQRGRELWTVVQRAFDAAARQLEDHIRLLRGELGTATEERRGRVARLFPWEGYGFLETPDGREVYFHRNAVSPPGFDRLAVGVPVRFHEEAGDKGPQASTVTMVSPRRASRRAS